MRRYARSFTGFSRDARLFLLTTVVYGAALSLYWTDFNLYLEALGLSRETIGLVATAGQLAGVVVALPAGVLSARVGRRFMLRLGYALVLVAFAAFLAGSLPLLFLGVVAYGAGTQTASVVSMPFMTEHTKPEHRNEYFAVQYALNSITNALGAIVGGSVAAAIAGRFGLSSTVGPYQVLLVAMVALTLLALGTIFLLVDDSRARGGAGQAAGSPRLGIAPAHRALLVRLLLPGFLISLGAGQVIPFLNVFVKGKFGLDLASLNTIFAVTSLGTAAAILIQPALARRFGKIGSVVLVQSASLPFFVVLGFSPVLWTVIAAMAVRNSLMNAGNPIYNAFAMEQLEPAERATYAAGANLLWSLGWAIAGPYYSILQGSLGFSGGYAVDFVTVIVLYAIGTGLYWHWFGRAERRTRLAPGQVPAAAGGSGPGS